VAELCDLLEEHLDGVRAGLVRLREQRAAGPVGDAPPVEEVPMLTWEDEGSFESDTDSEEEDDALPTSE